MRQIKTIIVVGDGMADEPIQSLGGRTPLQVARKPNMDFLAQHGIVGMLRTVPEGMSPASDIANMSLMGYDPRKYYTGRAPLEAASMGIRMGSEDVAFRCNLVTLGKEGDETVMQDYSGGGVSTGRARVWIRELNDKLGRSDRFFHPGVSYRHILLWKDARDLFESIETTPPHDITGRPVIPHLPRGSGSDELRSLMEEGRIVLSTERVDLQESAGKSGPNAIWLWGQGCAPAFPTIGERFGLTGATVCAVDLIKGLGRCAGMDTIHVPGATGDIDTNFQGKAIAALKAVRDHDLVFLHVEAPDEASHHGSLPDKIRAIERLDVEVIGILRKGLARMGVSYRLLVLPDHPTPLLTRTHSDQPVPFVFSVSPSSLSAPLALSHPAGKASSYDECEAAQTGLMIEEGHEMLGLLVDGAQ